MTQPAWTRSKLKLNQTTMNTRTLTFLLLLTAAPLTTLAQATFTKITTGAIVNDGGSSYGCAWGDYNNDGFIDLVVANGWGQTNFLYRNNGDSTFTKITVGPIVQDPADADAVVWGDHDNDGDLDLFVANFESPVQKDALYQNNGDGTFTKITQGTIVNDAGLGVGAAWADYDRDGWLDLYVANSRLQNDFLYHGNGDGTFTKILSGPVVTAGGTSIGCAWGDYDNDGDPDLVVANGETANNPGQNDFLFRNNGAGSFTRITSGSLVTDGAHAGSPAWADYDNDGDFDLIVVNALNENDRLYRNEGNGSFTLLSSNAVSMDGVSSVGVAWGDYDNDGWLDLFITGGSPETIALAGPNRLFHNRGDGSFEVINDGVLTGDGGGSLACAWGDLNNDGFLDLFVANTGDTDTASGVQTNNFLYRNNGNTNRWLMLKLVGSTSNRSAIGAKVRLKATISGQTLWQLREISGGSGYCSQNDLRAHFGLRDATNVDLVRIEWPSGAVQELPNVAANQILTVTEPPHLQVAGLLPDGSFQFQLTGVVGSRYALETSSNLTAWTPWTTVTNTSRTILVTDPFTTNAPGRFYRAVAQ